MKKSRKVRRALQAAVLGGLVFGGITLLVFFGDAFLGWTSGAGISFPGLVVAIVPHVVREVFGMHLPVSHGFTLLVNTSVGAVVFLSAGVFWEFCVKSEHEKDT